MRPPSDWPRGNGSRPRRWICERRPDRRRRCTTSSSSAVASSAARSLGCCRITHLAVALLEAGPDVGAGTSKANTAILHTGFDATPGSLESRLVARGYCVASRVRAVGRHLDRGRSGRCWWRGTTSRLRHSPVSLPRRAANGYEHTEIVDRAAVYEMRATPRARSHRRDAGPRRAHHRPVVDAARVRLRGDRQRCRPSSLNHEVVSCDVGDDVTTIATTAGADAFARDSSSTPLGCAATSSIARSASTDSRSGLAAVS